MSADKSLTSTTLVKMLDEDALLLDKIAALALLKNWEGEWNSRSDVVHHIATSFLSGLPEASREMLSPVESQTEIA